MNKKKTASRKKSDKTGKPVKSRAKSTGTTGYQVLAPDVTSTVQLLEGKHYGLIIVNVESLKVLYVNKKMMDISGYTIEDAEKYNALDVVVPSDRERMANIVKARMQGTDLNVSNRYTIITKSGQHKVLDALANPVIYKDQLCLHIMVHDITEKTIMDEKLNESNFRFENLYQFSPDAILTINNKGLITSVNCAVEKMTEYKTADLLDKYIYKIPIWESETSRNIKNILKKKSKTVCQCSLITRQGKYKKIEIHFNTYRLSSEESETFLLLRDITKQKLYENRLIESEAKYRAVVDNIADGIAIVYKNRCVYCNRNYLRLLGYKKDEILKRPITKVFPIRSKKVLTELINETCQNGRHSRRTELEARRKNGQVVHLTIRTAVINFENQKAVQLTATNVTTQKEAEIELRDTEERFRKLVENANYGFYIVDLITRKYHYMNKYGRSLLKKLKRTVGEFDSFNLLQKSDRKRVQGFWKKLMQGSASRFNDTIKINLPDGGTKWLAFESSLINYKGRECTQGIFRDVSQHYETIERLRKSEAKLQAIFQSIDDLIFVHDKEGRFLDFDQPLKPGKLYLQPDKYLGKTMKDVMPASITQQFNQAVAELKKSGQAQTMNYSLEIDGKESWFSSQITPMYNQQGKFNGMTSVIREITSIIKANQELERQRDFSNSILNTANSLIVCIDQNARITVFNKACEQKTGYKYEEVVGKHFPTLFIPKKLRSDIMKDGRKWLKEIPRVDYEAPILTKTGLEILGLWQTTTIEGDNPEDFVAITIGYDITERKKSVNALRDSELKFRAIFENTSDGISIYEYRIGSQKPRLIDCNSSFARMSGRSKQELLEMRDIRKIYVEDLSLAERKKRHALAEQGKSFKGTYCWVRPDKKENYIEFEATPVVLGNKILVYQIDRDITERRKTLDQLQESEEKYRSVVDNIGIGISLLSKDMRILSLNDQMKRWFPEIKLEQNPICFKSYNKPARKQACSYCPAVKTLADGQVHEDITDTPSNGKTRNFRIITSPIKDQKGNITAVIEMVEDITERSKAEEEIRKFKIISDRASHGTAIANLDGTLHYVNEAFAQMHGYAAEELIGKHLSILHNQDQIETVNKLNQQLVEKGSYTTEEVWHMHKDGTAFPTLMNGTVVYDDKKRPLFFSATTIDISELKQAEEKLQSSRDQYQILVENVKAVIAVFNYDGKIFFVNKLGANSLSDTVEEMMGRNMFDYFPPDIAEQQLAAVQNVIRTGKEYSGESKNFVNGHWEWYDTTIQPYKDIAGFRDTAIVITNNITERKQAEMVLKNQRDVLRKITSDVIKVQEEERRRISMELHDSIGQSISLSKLQIQNIMHSLNKDESELVESLDAVTKLLGDSVSDLRRISANLRPVILDNLGLWPTIDWYLKDFAKRTNLNVEINLKPIDLGLSHNDEAHFFRVVQEIMINIQKHSNAQNVVFNASKNKSHAIFVITEDGIGFNLNDIYETGGRVRGMGLINMMERVKIVSGKLDIKSLSSGGTEFILEMPLKK